MPDERMSPHGRKTVNDAASGTSHIDAEKSEDEIADAMAMERLGSTAGAGLGTKAKGFVPPRMNPGEEPAAYGERVRQAKEAAGSLPFAAATPRPRATPTAAEQAEILRKKKLK